MANTTAVAPTLPVTELEAFEELRTRALGKLGRTPVDLIVRHLLAVYRDGDWPLQRAAVEAVIRRQAFARRDDLVVKKRPRGRLGLGLYRVGRRADDRRPYRTLLTAVEPLVGSCDCPDFRKGGLGLCKHLLVVLDELASKPAMWQRAVEAGLTTARRGARLVWNPVRPLTGPGDSLPRGGWVPGDAAHQAGEGKAPAFAVQRWFSGNGAGPWRLSTTVAHDPAQRMELLGALRLWLQTVDPLRAIPDDPAVAPLVEEEFARRQLQLDSRLAATELEAAEAALKRPLYPYQREGVLRFLSGGRLLLADDMGLGKTVQAIAAGHALWHSGRVRRGLLVVPAPLKSQWQREWQSFTEVPITVVEGTPAQREAIYREADRGFLVVNYEQVVRDLPIIHGWRPDLIVLDEAQRIKNWATKTAASVKRLQPEYRLVLTGTPMENRLDELASIMDWVDEHAIEPKWRLAPWHATLCDGVVEIAGARNLDTLRTRLAPVMMRRIRREVLDQLPRRTDTRVPAELTPAQRAEHDELVPSIASLAARSKQRPLTQAEFLRLMQLLTTQRMICNGLAQLRFDELRPTLEAAQPQPETLLASLDSPKLVELREVIRHLVLDSQQKVVVFSQWRKMLELAQWATGDLLQSRGLRSAFFSGQENLRRRAQNIVEFHDDPSLTVLFATDAGGVGLNLQRAASAVVNLELPWNPAVLEQRIGRVYRLGQKHPVQVYNLVAEQGIEARIAAIVGNKQELFTGLFDGASDEVRFTGSARFMDGVLRLVEPLPPDILPVADEPDDETELEVVSEPLAAPAPTPMDAQPEPPPSPAPRRQAASPPPREPAPALPPGGAQVQQLLGSVRVERTADGGLRLEAPPETAETLAAMFQAMATLLGSAADRS